MTLEIMGLFQRLNEQGKTIIMVTHEPELAVYSRRVITLRDGQLVSDISIKDRRDALEDQAQWIRSHALLSESTPKGTP
jgi:putative ABC transport system ATP-binding protein